MEMVVRRSGVDCSSQRGESDIFGGMIKSRREFVVLFPTSIFRRLRCEQDRRRARITTVQLPASNTETPPSLDEFAIFNSLRRLSSMAEVVTRSRPPPILTPGNAVLHVKKPTFQTSFSNAKSPPYVLHVVPTSFGYLFAGSDDTIKAFDQSLSLLATLPSKQKGISSFARGAGDASTAVFSCATDGTVVGWDTKDLSAPAFSFKCNSFLCSIRRILISSICSEDWRAVSRLFAECRSKLSRCWYCAASPRRDDRSLVRSKSGCRKSPLTKRCRDLRTLKLAHTWTEAHSDDITALSFHPTVPHLLLSASVDGLINTHDIRVASEDDSIMSTAQVGASVSQVGWVPLEGQSALPPRGVWSSTTIETVQLWDAEDVGALPWLERSC